MTLTVKVYFDLNDWWIGYYRGDEHHYVCPVPTLVIRWKRSGKTSPWIQDIMIGYTMVLVPALFIATILLIVWATR